MDALEIRTVSTDREQNDAFAIRRTVFVDEQGVNASLEYDDHDHEPTTTHLVAYDSSEPVGAARLRAVSGDRDPDDDHAEKATPLGKIERVAVLESRRNEGIGRALMDRLESIARSQSLGRIRLHAQRQAAGFYRQLGYHQVGKPFEEAGIPHIAMEKALE